MDNVRYSNEISLKIYDEVFSRFSEKKLDIFLCGGVSSNRKKSLRDSIRKKIEKDSNVFRILYPEDIFMELLNRNKNYDLLKLENFLADNCDVICIICESAGSLVELGAFTNYDKTFEKVVAAIDNKKKKNKSFIIQGPVKLIQKNNSKNVVYYKNMDDLYNQLFSIFRDRYYYKRRSKLRKNDLDSIVGMYYFILILIYFYKTIGVKEIINYIKHVSEKRSIDIKEFETLFTVSLKLLHRDRLIEKIVKESKVYYSFTAKGYGQANKLLDNIEIKLRDRIRFDIINNEFY